MKRLEAAKEQILEQKVTTCRYGKSDKTWSADPQGFAWKTFYTSSESNTYGASAQDEGLPAHGGSGSACFT